MEHYDGRELADRLSALPDDVLIHILLKLHDAPVAARTCVLSTRWRRLWTLLPELRFPTSCDSISIRSALESHEAPALDQLYVDLKDASPESVAGWLPVAARRLSGVLCFEATRMSDEAAEGGALELPSFEKATRMYLSLGYLGLAVPPSSGIFAQLTHLCLDCIKLRGPCMLGDLVSSPRCPVLRTLTVRDAWCLGNFAIRSQSLLEIELKNLHDLQQLTVVAPALKHFDVFSCFVKPYGIKRPVANISAPQLVLLSWVDAYDPRFTQFGEMENVKSLVTNMFVVYGRPAHMYGRSGYDQKLYNSFCVGILRLWCNIDYLKIMLFFGAKDITNREYLMEDITKLPNTRNLILDIVAKGHSCGPSLYHVLKMCTGVRNLSLELLGESGSLEAHTACPSGCVCDQPPNWKTDVFALNCLQEVKVTNLRGTENEAGLVKRLFEWATVLQTMKVTFDSSVAESKAKEFCQMLQSFSRPEVCFEGPHFA